PAASYARSLHDAPPILMASAVQNGAMSAADYNKLTALAGIQLEADQANALIHIKDGNGNVLSTLNVAFLNNEGTTFVYNPVTNTDRKSTRLNSSHVTSS